MTVKDRMDDWDRNVAPVLNIIELKAIWAKTYIDAISGLVDKLPSKPNWTTLAEDKLEQTISSLEAVLAKLKQAHQNYQNKEVV